MIAPRAGLPVSRQCTLTGIARSSFYYRPRPLGEQHGEDDPSEPGHGLQDHHVALLALLPRLVLLGRDERRRVRPTCGALLSAAD